MDAILLTSPDGTIQAANPAACAMFQWTEGELLNKGRDLIVDATDSRLPEAMEEQNRTGQIRRGTDLCTEGRYTVPRGGLLQPLFQSQWRKPDEHDHPGYLRAHGAGADLRIANRKLNLMNMVASHDIYNKIIGIRGYIDLSRIMSPTQGGRNTSRGRRRFSRASSTPPETQKNQKMEQEQPRWNNLGTLLENVRVTGVAGSIPVVNDTGNLEIFADPIIEKVFWHLMDNSVKHGETVTEIRISARESGSACMLVYEDNGVGIPGSRRPDLFTKSFGKMTGFDVSSSTISSRSPGWRYRRPGNRERGHGLRSRYPGLYRGAPAS